MKTILKRVSVYTAITISISACWTSMDYDINNGVNFRLYENTNSFEFVFYASNHKYSGCIYTFYQNGMINEISIPYQNKSLIYDKNGQLQCYRYDNFTKDENTHTYCSLDSAVVLKIISNDYLLIYRGDTLKFNLTEENTRDIMQSNLFLSTSTDSIRLFGITRENNKNIRLISFPK